MHRSQITQRPTAAPAGHGFTLPELLIVIGIIVLMLAIAVPTFNLMTGANSIEGAQNMVAANLAQARLSAIGQQQPRGLVFYRDPATDRIAAAMVRVAARSEWATNPPGFDPIEIVTETDTQFLPKGVDVAFRHNHGTDADDYVYRLDDIENLRGLVLFDGQGRIIHRAYGIGDGTELARRLGVTSHDDDSDGGKLYSQPAFLLADRSAADSVEDLKDYLNRNAAVVLVNRYNGTLTRSE